MNKEGVTFEFVAYDYQKISTIKLFDIRLNNSQNEIHVSKDKLRDSFDEFFDNILKEALKRIENKLSSSKEWDGDKYYIGRNETRKDEKISIFMPSDESRINGVIGRISVELAQNSNLYIPSDMFKGIKDKKKFDRIPTFFVDIIFQSRLDYENDSKEDTHLGYYNGEKYMAANSFFAAEMLTYGMVDKYNGDVSCNIENLFDFLLIDLLIKSMEVAIVKGTYKTYRLFEENNDRIRGSIDVARHIRLNAGQQTGRVAFKYRENTINNYLNVLIVKAYQSISKKYPILVEKKITSRPELHNYIKNLMYETDSESITIRTAIIKNLKPIAHPYYREFDKTRKICLSILRNEGVNIFESDDCAVNSFLFYLPDLWENFLISIFKEILSSSDLEEYEIIDQMNEANYIEGNTPNKYLLHLKPDFLFKKKNGKRYKLNLDAKCIPGWDKINKGEENLHKKENERIKKTITENIDECLRYLEVFNTEATGVIYPVKYYGKKEGVSDIYDKYVIKRRISEISKKFFYTLPFFVPASSSGKYTRYSSWKSVFEVSKRQFIEKMGDGVFRDCLLEAES